jgi:hypothetical protein
MKEINLKLFIQNNFPKDKRISAIVTMSKKTGINYYALNRARNKWRIKEKNFNILARHYPDITDYEIWKAQRSPK